MPPAPLRFLLATTAALILLAAPARGQRADAPSDIPEALRATIQSAADAVKPSLVRIHVVETSYRDGREYKYQTAGSGAIITEAGHIITNHHVAGHATRLVCTLADKEEVEAVLVGTDPMTDIAVIKLTPEEETRYPVATFGDSTAVRVGDRVLAMGSPMALSQSVTLGIVSNTEIVMPEWLGRWGEVSMDGEDVGSLVRWIGHDAEIFGGNSGGPLVDLEGRIIGINELGLGSLGGAIPGNLARDVAFALIEHGEVERAWLGVHVQPRLKSTATDAGVLVGGVLPDSPAEKGGIEPGDVLLEVGGEPVDVRFPEQMPGFNLMVAGLSIGEAVDVTVVRDGSTRTLSLTPEKREKAAPKQHELEQWGVTARNLSYMIATEMKRDNQDGVLVTSTRPGGPAGDAKPSIEPRDVIVEVAGEPVRSIADLVAVTRNLTKGAEEPVPALVSYERGAEQYLTVVEVGVKELEDPGLEVQKAWLPVNTQVLTRDIAEKLPREGLTGFRITKVYEGTTADEAGLRVGDYLLAVDGERLTANAPEDYDDLPQLIRQYRIGAEVELRVLRGPEEMTIPVELVASPKLPREMKRYRDELFDFTVRNITFFDRADEEWERDQEGVLVEEVQSGGWADVALLESGDLVLEVGGEPVSDVVAMEERMDAVSAEKPEAVVFKVLRGVYTTFVEIEPDWDGPAGDNEE
jgi:serine protease Do